ncbi:Rv1733c family protein [Microbispora sp. CA-102843]|uniref:Rv1733c family protein n=1 Tax=Microbispora sp. CA-102843 TaxID=3239952 RepID=UPI003D93A5C2
MRSGPVTMRVRRYLPNGNPLRRGTDRVESAAVLAFLILAVLSLVAAFAVGAAVYRGGLAEEHSGRWVTATVTRDAPAATWVAVEGTAARLRTGVAWTAPDGHTVTGQAPVPSAAKAGTPVRIWLDHDGKPGDGPRSRIDTVADGVASGTATAALSLTALLACLALVRRRLDHHRYAAWDAGWLAMNRRRKPEDA